MSLTIQPRRIAQPTYHFNNPPHLGDAITLIADVLFPKPRNLGTAMDTQFDPQSEQPSIDSIINRIYQAALQPYLWPDILSDIRLACSADQCTLFFYDGLEPERSLASAARADEHILSQYLKHYIQQQATQINHQLNALPEGQVVTDRDMRQFVGEEYSGIVGKDYMQTFWPNLKFEAGIVLLRGEIHCAGLGLQNFSETKPLSAQSINLLQSLSPHLRQAMRLHQQLAQFSRTNDALKSVLQACKVGIILLDDKLNIHFINNKARHSLVKVEHLPLPKQLVLEKINNAQINKIVAQFNLLTKADKNPLNNNLNLNYKSGHLKINGYLLQQYLSSTELKSPSSPSYLLLIQDSNSTCELNLQYLQSAYEITAAERKLILGLINGASVLDSAESQTVKPSTIRWHLKNIMQKTLTHSQTELTRLMLELRD